MLLFCPRCDQVIEVRDAPRALPCDCGGELELFEVVASNAQIIAVMLDLAGQQEG